MRLCGVDRAVDRSVHAAYAPLHLEEYREKVCPCCLVTWALEGYSENEEVPEFVSQIRAAAMAD
jgi:hypothetical protein